MQLTNSNIDIFCHVIDNFGDAGVVYRLAKEYQCAFPKAKIRIFTDGMAAFQAVCPQIQPYCNQQTVENIHYLDYSLLTDDFVASLTIPELIIEAFACDIPEIYLQKAAITGRLLINLDYLMAEEWVEGFHGKESLLGYPQLKKFFFMPGFTAKTGGLLAETHLEPLRMQIPDRRPQLLKQLFKKLNLDFENEDNLIGTLFSYEHNFENLYDAILNLNRPVILLVFGSKSQKSWQYLFTKKVINQSTDGCYRMGLATVVFCDFLAQSDYDLLLNLTDFNIVRGEDSLARAVRSGIPFLWHCYLQEEKYQLVKVEAFTKVYLRYADHQQSADYLSRLFYQFNDRETDNFTEECCENFAFFFNNLIVISETNRRFADFLRNNCNLVEKLLSFVRSLPD